MTLFSVVAVTCRFVGVVGGVRSFAARTGDGLRSTASTINTVATCVVNFRKYSLFIFLLLVDEASTANEIAGLIWILPVSVRRHILQINILAA